MANALNLTIPLKQDPQTQESLKNLVASFAQVVQPKIDAVLLSSEIVHFARILVIDNKYLQVLTEFDGDPMGYTEFFHKELGWVFQEIFSLAEGAPSWEELKNPGTFSEYARRYDVAALGTSTVGNEDRGYLFSAMGDKTVRELRAALCQNGCAPAQPEPAWA